MRNARGLARPNLGMKAKTMTTVADLGLEPAARLARQKMSGLARFLARTDERIITDYVTSHEVRKLHIGCGENYIDGWLNADYDSRSDNVLRFDATRRFPFERDIFDFVFTEHMIEHVSYTGARNMLAECYRVLRRGGKIRISTPDLESVVALRNAEKTPQQVEYIAYHCEAHDSPYQHEVFVINDFFRLWGHIFIYDEESLKRLMEQVGFVSINRVATGDSGSVEFRGLENVDRMPAGMLDMISFTVEGSKQ